MTWLSNLVVSFAAAWIGGGDLLSTPTTLEGVRWETSPITVYTNDWNEVFGRATFTRRVRVDAAGLTNGFAVLSHEAREKKAYRTIRVNGKYVYAPNHISYDGRLVQSHDVAALLVPGENVITAEIDRLPPVRGAETAIRLDLALGVREFGERCSPAFRKTFTPKGAVRRAELKVTGVGFYEARLNGRKVGHKVLDPSPTDYAKRVLYSTYPVELAAGENTLEIDLGHGWFDVRTTDAWGADAAPWRARPCAWAELEIDYADGTRETVATDATWDVTESPVLYDCIREGEVYDARCERRVLGKATVVAGPAGKLEPERIPGAEVTETFRPTAVKDLGDGRWMLAFPENISGWLRVNLRGQAPGTRVSFRYDERVNAGLRPAEPKTPGERIKRRPGVEYRLVDAHIRAYASWPKVGNAGAAQQDHYICRGGDETYEPRFVYHGFRYVLVSGLAGELRAEDVTACAVNTAFAAPGRFECSDADLGRALKLFDRAYRSNFTDGIPTDCPHREKNGWTGDSAMAVESAQFCYENTAGYEKWLRDIADAQRADGAIPGTVPTSGWGFDVGGNLPGPGWDAALWMTMRELELYRGDHAIAFELYPALRRHVEWTERQSGADGICAFGLPDWCPPQDGANKAWRDFTSTAFAVGELDYAAGLAKRLGKADDAVRFAARAAVVRKAARAKFRAADGAWCDGGTVFEAMAVYFGLCEGAAERDAAVARIAANLAANGCHIDFGIFGMRIVPEVLGAAGRSDLVYKMLMNPTAPSLKASFLDRGATTLWEHWRGQASLNHVMYGGYVAWAYRYLAGVRPTSPGYATYVVEPTCVDGIDYVKASVPTPRGTIEVEWRRGADGKPVLKHRLVAGDRSQARGMRYERYHNTYHESAVYKIMLKNKQIDKPLTTLDEAHELVKRIHDLSGGIHQVVYLVGWQYAGHDSKYPSWDKVGDHCRSSFGDEPLAALRAFIRAMRKYNCDVSLHVNVNDAYKSSPHWQFYLDNGLLRLGKDGQPRPHAMYGGEQCYQVSHAKEWKAGVLQKRILALLEMIPELRETRTIHIDALFGVDSESDGVSLEEDVAAIDAMVDFWHAQGMDVTTENLTDFDQVGYFPMVYHLNLDERHRIQYPPEVICGGDSGWNARRLNFYMYDQAWKARTPDAGCLYEEAWGDGHWGDLEGRDLAETNRAAFAEKVFSRALLHAWYNRSRAVRNEVTADRYVVEREKGATAVVAEPGRRLTVTDNGRLVVSDGDYFLDFPYGGGTVVAFSTNGCDREFALPRGWRLPDGSTTVRLTLAPGESRVLRREMRSASAH